MIKTRPRSQLALQLSAAAMLFATGVANADSTTVRLNGYEEEMNRCIDLLRPAMQSVKSGKVIYDVQEIDLRGPWYQFEISVSVENEAGARSVDGYRVGCKSNRWVELAELQQRRNTQQLPVQAERYASQ